MNSANRLNKDTWSDILSFIDPIPIESEDNTRFRVAQTNKEIYSSLQGSFTGQKIDLYGPPSDSSLTCLKNLRKINFWCGATDGVMKYFENVHDIVVMWGNNITDSGLQHLKNVKTLELRGSNITDDGLAHLENVEELFLKGTDRITDAGLAHLTKVKEIDLRMCDGITDAGLTHLKNVEIIWCRDCKQITEAGKQILKDKGVKVHD